MALIAPVEKEIKNRFKDAVYTTEGTGEPGDGGGWDLLNRII